MASATTVRLALPSVVDSTVEWFVAHLPGMIGAVIVFVAGWLVARVLAAGTRRVLARMSTQAHVDLLVARTVQWSVMTVGLVTALAVAGVDVGTLVASLGLVGVTLGFALRDVLANSVAGVALLLQHPFTIGDTVVLGTTEGVVQDVRIRDTALKLPDGRVAFIPNLTVFNGIVINVSREAVRRFEIALWTASGADLDASCAMVLEAVRATPGVLAEPAAEAQIAAIGPERARVVARAWVHTGEHGLGATQSEALTRARAALGQAEAEVAGAPASVAPSTPDAGAAFADE